MSTLGLRNSRLARKRQRRWRMLKYLAVLGLIAGLGVFSYQTGSELAQQRVADLQTRNEDLRTRLDQALIENEQLKLGVEEARQKESAWRERYTKEVPQGDSKALFVLMAEGLERGVEPDRLETMIRAAMQPRKCTGNPTTKRFLAQTPLYSGANSAVAFADGAITVTASGETATDSNGNREAWFDPAKPVSVQFTSLGGEVTKAEGELPVHQSVLANGREYRFTVRADDARGFVTVTADACRQIEEVANNQGN